jgi:SRSO17 transposase
VTAPERTAAQHQSLLHLVARAPWSDAAVLRRVRERMLPAVTREEPIQAWITNDTGYPKTKRYEALSKPRGHAEGKAEVARPISIKM